MEHRNGAPDSTRFCFRNQLFYDVFEASQSTLREQFRPLMRSAKIPFVLRRSWFRGCETLVLVTFLNLSNNALYTTLMHSTPLHSTMRSEQRSTTKQDESLVVSCKKLIFTICLHPRERAWSKNVATDNVSEAFTQRRAQGRLSVAC